MLGGYWLMSLCLSVWIWALFEYVVIETQYITIHHTMVSSIILKMLCLPHDMILLKFTFIFRFFFLSVCVFFPTFVTVCFSFRPISFLVLLSFIPFVVLRFTKVAFLFNFSFACFIRFVCLFPSLRLFLFVVTGCIFVCFTIFISFFVFFFCFVRSFFKHFPFICALV